MDITKRQAREALNTNDAGLALFFGVSKSAVSQWEEDKPIPELRRYRAAVKRPDIFGDALPARRTRKRGS